MSSPPKAPVGLTALIASRNEARLLERRLPELAFCDQIIVADIASRDDTRSVASAAGATVVSVPWVPIAECVRDEMANRAAHDLLLVSDPDEEIPPVLAGQLASLPETIEPDIGVVVVPLVYFFGGRPLHGTIWGGVSKKRLVVRRSGVVFVSEPHRPYGLRPGFRSIEIPYDGANAIRHHWVSGYRAFIKKHWRYLRIEGASRAKAGEVMGLRALVRTPWRTFRTCYLTHRGWRDGVRGLLLSVLYAGYRTGSDIELLRVLRRTS